MRSRPIVAAVLAAAAALGGASTTTAASPAAPDDTTMSDHANVIAQGVIEVGTADHVWVLNVHAVGEPVDVPAMGPTFVLPRSGPVRLHAGEGHGAFVEPGEAGFVHAGHEHQLEATAPTDVLEVGLAGGEGDGAFPLEGGLYDFELVRDTLAAGETLAIAGAIESLVLVTGGELTLADGGVLPAGFNAPVSGDVELANGADGSAAVLVAVISSFDAPSVAGVPAPTPAPAGDDSPAVEPAGSPTPGGTPSAPSDSAATSTTPAPSPTPTSPGDTASADATTTLPPAATPTTTTVTPTEPPPTTTTPPPIEPAPEPVELSLVSCSGNTSLSIVVDATAGSGYRRNISSVVVQRDNEFGNFGSGSPMSWREDSPGGSQWGIANVIGQRPDMGDRIRITATADDGRTAVIEMTLDDC